MKLKPIVWKTGYFGTTAAMVNGSVLGSFYYDACISRDDNTTPRYRASVTLGTRVWRKRYSDPDEAKEAIESVIELFTMELFE